MGSSVCPDNSQGCDGSRALLGGSSPAGSIHPVSTLRSKALDRRKSIQHCLQSTFIHNQEITYHTITGTHSTVPGTLPSGMPLHYKRRDPAGGLCPLRPMGCSISIPWKASTSIPGMLRLHPTQCAALHTARGACVRYQCIPLPSHPVPCHPHPTPPHPSAHPVPPERCWCRQSVQRGCALPVLRGCVGTSSPHPG